MTEHRDDSILDRAADVLRELPPVDRTTVSRIVAAAARAREVDVEPHVDDLLAPAPARRSWWPAIIAAAVAAGLVGFFVGHQQLGVRANPTTAPIEAGAAGGSISPGTAAASLPVSTSALDQLAVPTQFVFDAPRAKRVALIGDFNGWDEHAAPLQREAGSSLWSVTVPLGPGRHVYAFVVDSTWTTDPRAPEARDPDFGIAGSVIIVGKP